MCNFKQLLLKATDQKGVCPVCEKGLNFLPWNDGLSSLEICPRCFIQFGYDDMAGGDKKIREKIYAEWRMEWIKNGRLNKWRPIKKQIIDIIARAKN